MNEIKMAFYVIFTYLGIKVEAFGILILLMSIDSILGAIKSIRLGREFKFKILIWGFIMKLCFLIIPLVVALLAKAVGYDFNYAINIVMIVLSISEGYSIFGNIYSAKNKVEVKSIDGVSLLLKSLRVAMKNMIFKLLGKIEENVKQ